MVVHSLHVVEQVVPPWEAIARKTALAACVEAKVRAVAVTVHAMSLALVTKQASGGGEFLLGACLLPASEGLQVRVNELAVKEIVVSYCSYDTKDMSDSYS